MKKLLFILPVLILVFVCSAGFAAGKMEGDGYDSPEEAVLAYLDAMNRGDVGGMLSTFAIESYAENMDPVLYTQYRRQYSPSANGFYLPREDIYALSLAAQARYGDLANAILCDEAYAAFRAPSVSVGTAEERAALEEQFRQSAALNPVGNVEFVRWASPVGLTRGQIAHPAAGRSLAINAYVGAEDLTERIAEIRINGKTAYQGMTCARYGGRWYNLEFGGRILGFSGVSDPYSQILWLPTEEQQAQINESLAEEYPEENARWEAVQQSEIAGEIWPLVSLDAPDAPDVTLYSTADGAASDSGSGIYAEIHFFRNGGGVLTVTAGAALREKLYMDDASGRILFSWSPDGIELYYISKRGKEVPTYDEFYKQDIELPSAGSVVLNEQELTVILSDGTRAVFRSPETPEEAGIETAAAETIRRLEGEGFATPEEAVAAYIEAMKRGDVRGMLSTFALESFTEHADPWVYLERLGFFSAKLVGSAGTGVPYVNEYIRSLSAYARYGAVSDTLLEYYMKIATQAEMLLALKEPDDITAFLEQIRRSPLYGLAGNVEFLGWLDPAVLTDGDVMIQPDFKYSALLSGGDEVAEVAALVQVNGRNACQTMRCVRYGDCWYNLDLIGSTALILNYRLGNSSLDEVALILLADDEFAERVAAGVSDSASAVYYLPGD